jgi:tetratricopeptide (TPR) repeat protein
MRNLAEAYALQGKFELAIAILTNALALEPEDPSLLGRMAIAHLKLGERPKARAALEKAIALPGGATAEIYNNLGLVYHEAGDFVGAEDLFRKALARWPAMLPARVNLGNALKGQQKYAEADAVLRDALQQSPRSSDALYNLGILYLDGQIPGMEAVARLERALAYFEQYRQVAASKPAGDPVEQYVAEAQKRIDVEKKKAAQARQAPKEPEGGAAPAGDEATAKDGAAAPAQAGVDGGGEEK